MRAVRVVAPQEHGQADLKEEEGSFLRRHDSTENFVQTKEIVDSFERTRENVQGEFGVSTFVLEEKRKARAKSTEHGCGGNVVLQEVAHCAHTLLHRKDICCEES